MICAPACPIGCETREYVFDREVRSERSDCLQLVSQYQLAKQIGVPARRINEIVHGQRRVSADTALRLARYFGTSERFWINLQSRYDLEIEGLLQAPMGVLDPWMTVRNTTSTNRLARDLGVDG